MLCFFLSSLLFSPVQTDKKISIEHASHRKFTFPWLHPLTAHCFPLSYCLCLYSTCACVLVRVCLPVRAYRLGVLTSVLARGAECVQRFVVSLSIHTLLSSQIEFSEDMPHLLVWPAYECCYPVLSSLLTKRSIGFWAGSLLAHCTIYIAAFFNCG